MNVVARGLNSRFSAEPQVKVPDCAVMLDQPKGAVKD